MQFRKLFLATLLVLGICSCDFDMWASNYDFETNAIYVAPKSRATAIVLTEGYVPKGADLGDLNECVIDARINFSDKPTDVIKITSNGRKVLSTLINNKPFLFNDSMDYTSVLIDCSKKLGVTNIDLVELEEFGKVILSTGYGPKGTVLKGQSETILVDSVRYTTKDR
jgi:hypothetical protein